MLCLGFRFSSPFLPYHGQIMTSRLFMVQEPGVPDDNHRLTTHHFELSHMLRDSDLFMYFAYDIFENCFDGSVISFLNNISRIDIGLTQMCIYS